MKINLKTTVRFAFVLLLLAFVCTSCADAVNIDECRPDSPYGFFGGLWHGIISPFAFFGSLFSDGIALYAVNNSGGWYDFGFVLGAGILWFGGGKAS